ncbi:MAG TPA: endonuclease MutS2 [Erysipelotrichaceae bacterium]|nr:endonuclease MutS2 [Erysipelotrichaceae bacterium]
MKNNYETLEFPVIRQMIADRAITSLAKMHIQALDVTEDSEEANEALKKVSCAMDMHRILGRLPLTPMDDITLSLKKADMDGTLTCEELWNINSVLKNVKSLHNYFASYEGDLTAIRDEVEGLVGDDQLSNEIERCIEPDMRVSDHASPALYRLRKAMLSMQNRIRKTMEGYLKDNKDLLSMDTLSSKNDHLVLPVKAGHKNDIKGIVHATSATSQTYFIEPESVVAMNNEYNTLVSDEHEEVQRILHQLTKQVARVRYHLKFDQELMEALDFIFAKARFGVEYDCCIPVMGAQQLSLKQARHPLIDQKKVVANDIILDTQALMITGSNTGGKTVALKTAGLLALMGQCALPVPAVNAEIPFYRGIFVDVGDEQSIEASLSTYSSHMKRLIQITQEADDTSLVLIDEIGSGTDPQEGAALAKAIISYLLDRGATLLLSTHYGELKTFGKARDDITLASVGFDMETMQPTYHLTLHSVGMSYAFEIAESLGLKDEIVKAGLAYKEESVTQEAKLMEKLEKQEQEIALKQEKVDTLLADNEKLHEKYSRQLAGAKKQKEQILNAAHEKANSILEESKAMVDEVVADLKAKGSLKDHEVIAAKHDLDDLKYKKKEKKKVQTHVFALGDHVRIDAMNREGEISAIGKNHEVTVSIGGLPIKLKDTEITFLHGKTNVKVKKARTHSATKKTGSYEVNVIGMRYVEAMETVDKFLDDALMLGYPSIRIIHGMGTGTLRKGIRKMLDHKDFVESYRDGGPNEGGLGATLVYFK